MTAKLENTPPVVADHPNGPSNHVIIAGFGVGGRFIAEYLREKSTPFVIVELNPLTCDAQRCLGVHVIEGDIADDAVLRRAGIETASVLALAIPDEDAALRATERANAIRPDIHIIASTRYTSTGLEALQRGADEVIVAEQAVAQEFYRRIDRFISRTQKKR
ncbi:MAG TPA: NAD(P)-binding protein [Phycisphaerae bacterium]|nr:NAD(P)-binding protein [Phycisphaerae bacterium]